jgi:hypothetical protein
MNRITFALGIGLLVAPAVLASRPRPCAASRTAAHDARCLVALTLMSKTLDDTKDKQNIKKSAYVFNLSQYYAGKVYAVAPNMDLRAVEKEVWPMMNGSEAGDHLLQECSAEISIMESKLFHSKVTATGGKPPFGTIQRPPNSGWLPRQRIP